MERWRLDGKDYTSVGDYVKALEQNYFKVNSGYHFYRDKYAKIMMMVNDLISESHDYFEQELSKGEDSE